MKHPDKVEKFNGTLAELAADVGNMRYDHLEEFLAALADNISEQSKGDAKRGRPQLSKLLSETAEKLRAAKDEMEKIWRLCKKYMDS